MACAGRSPAMGSTKINEDTTRLELKFYLIGTLSYNTNILGYAKEAFAIAWLGCLNNKDTIERLEWTSWELTEILSIGYN